MATTASVYNTSRTTRQVLKRHRKEGPSLILHLHGNTFRFERQDGAFLCESPLKNLLHFIRDQKVPADLVDIFDEARVPFFEGCLIIEVHDHRSPSSSQNSAFPTPAPALTRLTNGTSNSSSEEASTSIFNSESSARVLGGNYGFLRRLGVDARNRNGDQTGANGSSSPSVYRVVLYPSAETLWTDLRMLNEVDGAGLWTDEDVLEIESRILTLTSPPLCLTPDLQVSRIANLMLSATAPPCSYSPLPTAPLPYFRQSDRKRGINSIEVELDESNKKKREKIMRMYEKGSSSKAKEAIVGASTQAPSFARLSFVERWRSLKAANELSSNVKMSDGGVAGEGGNQASNGGEEQKATSSKNKSKKKKVTEEEKQETKESTPPSAPTAKKKSKKKAQKEKEEKEEKERLEKEIAERAAAEAAAAAAAADKVKTEETKKKGKKSKKKELAAQQQQEAEAAEAEAAAAAAAAEASKKPTTKKASKSKKAKIQPSPVNTQASTSSDSQQQQGNLGTTPQQAAAMNLNMYPKQMVNYLMMNQQQQQQQQQQALAPGNSSGGVGGLPSAFPNQYGSGNNGTGLNLPGGGQTGNYSSPQQQQQQQLQQAAIQRALQQSGMNTNFMMNSNHPNQQMQQHLQALAAMQQQQQQQQHSSDSPQSMQQQGQQSQFQSQDAATAAAPLPVGVGLGNLPLNWNGMG